MISSPVFTCICCRIKFEESSLQREHFKSDWHVYNLKRKICNLDPIDLVSFERIQADQPEVPHHNIEEGECDDDWEDIEDEEEMDDEAYEMLERVVKPDTCLFCGKKAADIKSNLSHMNRAHGFFIPEEQYLIDHEGLLEYLGFKVGAGATCLWCNKEFTSLHGVRLHMLYKDHCKILYDQEKAIEEFKDFYDYADQEKFEMKPLNQLAIPKRGIERKSNHYRALVRVEGPRAGNSRQLVSRKGLSPVVEQKLAKNFKKFDAIRAKIILKIGMTNNNTMRSRIRLQNPM